MRRPRSSTFMLAVTLGLGAHGCAVDDASEGPEVIATRADRLEATSNAVIWAESDGEVSSAGTREVIVSLRSVAATYPTSDRLGREAIVAGANDLAGHLVLLDALVGLYRDETKAREVAGRGLDALRASYGRTPLAQHLDFDAFLAKNRAGDQVRIHYASVAAWVGSADYRGLAAGGATDYDDDGDLDLFLVNAPGGDNARGHAANNLKQLALATYVDVDGDGELELGLVAAPKPVEPVFAIIITLPAIQKAAPNG